MKINKLHIVYLGCSGFPYGFAEVERLKLISKALINAGHNVTILNPKGVHQLNAGYEIHREGVFEGIRYIYATKSPFRPSNFIDRNFKKMKGRLNEIIILFRLNKSIKISIGIISNMHFSSLIYYVVLSKILKFKTILNFVELQSSIQLKSRCRFNDYLFDHYAFLLTNGTITISNYLQNIIIEKTKTKKSLKIPAICDFNLYNNHQNYIAKDYFLYCGSVNYSDVIGFILNAFDEIHDSSFRLVLIINGDLSKIQYVKEKIYKSHKKSLIDIYSSLQYNELIKYYLEAKALLIPIRPILQDLARFPHKIGEYSASGRPIITTNMGEVRYYFKDMLNALIAEEYNYKLFAEKMDFVINNPNIAEMIGKNGKDIGEKFFSYAIYSDLLTDYFNKTLNICVE